jgi:hypothetical protein
MLAKHAELFGYLTEKKLNVKQFEWMYDSTATVNRIIRTIDPFTPQACKYIFNKASYNGNIEKDLASLGLTKDFCPVTLQEQNILVRCNSNIAAQFQVFFCITLGSNLLF